jgi:hypothetical protein
VGVRPRGRILCSNTAFTKALLDALSDPAAEVGRNGRTVRMGQALIGRPTTFPKRAASRPIYNGFRLSDVSGATVYTLIGLLVASECRSGGSVPRVMEVRHAHALALAWSWLVRSGAGGRTTFT